jgi:DNA polymerase III epsilon subunit-like protein
MTTEIPIFRWFDQIPEEHRGSWLTRNQLSEQGLRPARGAEPVARVVWRRGERRADLFDKHQAVPKRPLTAAQQAAQERRALQRRTCPRCGTVGERPVSRPWDWPDCPECERRQIAADRAEAIAVAREALDDPRALILDLETTGLHGSVVEVAVITVQGEVLLNRRVEPEHPISEEAARLHGITEVGLAGAPVFAGVADALSALLFRRRVWTYNTAFDSGVLEREIERLAQTQAQSGLLRDRPRDARWFARRAAQRWVQQMRWRCAMELYAAFVGEWSQRHWSYRYQPLPAGDQSALGDALATLEVLRQIAAAATEPPCELEAIGEAENLRLAEGW